MSQWTTVQHRLTFVAQQKAGKVVVQTTSSILNGIEHHRSTTFNMLNDLFNIQYSRMINYSTVADQKMLNSASLVVKLNFFHIGCFRVCSGGGVEENFPCFKLWSFTSQTFGLRGISARSSYFIQVYFLSVLLSFLYFFLFTLFWLFYCFCCCFISYFFLFGANFSVFLLISALEQRGGGDFLGWGAREGAGY